MLLVRWDRLQRGRNGQKYLPAVVLAAVAALCALAAVSGLVCGSFRLLRRLGRWFCTAYRLTTKGVQGGERQKGSSKDDDERMSNITRPRLLSTEGTSGCLECPVILKLPPAAVVPAAAPVPVVVLLALLRCPFL